MLRIVITVVVASLVGFGLGRVQTLLFSQRLEERFSGARAMPDPGGPELKSAGATESKGTPKLEVVGGLDYDFGSMLHGDTNSHEFVVRNAGEGPLRLRVTDSTCKCTVGDLKKNVLQPGEESIIELTWTAQSVTRQFGQSATVETNDPQNSEIKFSIHGTVRNSLVIEPPMVSLDDVPQTDGTTRTFHVFAYIDGVSELRDLMWTTDRTKQDVKLHAHAIAVDAERFPEHAEANNAFEVTVEVPPDLPIGPLNSRIHFRTDLGEDIGGLDVPVTGRIVGDVALIGGTVFDSRMSVLKLGNVPSSEGKKASIMLAVQGAARETLQPEIASITPSESLNVTIGEPKTIGKRIMYPIHFEVPEGAPPVNYSGTSSKNFGKVTIATNDEAIDEISIYVRLVVVE